MRRSAARPAGRRASCSVRCTRGGGQDARVEPVEGAEEVGHAQRKGTKLNHIEPGEPNQNAYIERFGRTYRHQMLDAYVFKSIEQVQDITEAWLRVYTEQRPHDALGGLHPKQFLLR